MRTIWMSAMMAVVVMSLADEGLAFPKPSLVPGPKDWTFHVVFDQPRQINLTLPGETQPKRFWYLILTLTQAPGAGEAPFYPACDLVTDSFKVIPAGKGISKVVFDQIKRLHQGQYPFLEWIEHCNTKVLPGRDNARDVAIIWQDFDPKAKSVFLFISGLSNETVVIPHPVNKDTQGNPEKVLLRKTLALEYGIGGDATLRSVAGMSFKDKSWVLR
ncbi:MAG: hypothetical protein GX455_17665 [Phycisphaerae bacterium]|nr:hypothetical protein [Phycisphaerae bacterium]